MNDSKYRYILYVIVVVIIATIGIQTYWNYKNYLTNKQQLINDVQASLDDAVDNYYTALATRTTLGVSLEGEHQKNAFRENGELEKFLQQIDGAHKEFRNLDSIDFQSTEGFTVVRGFKADSMMAADKKDNQPLSNEELKKRIDSFRFKSDSISFNLSSLEMLTTKVVISINNDTLDIEEVDSLLKIDLARKNIDISYRLNYIEKSNKGLDSCWIERPKIYQDASNDKLFLSSISKSSFIPLDSVLSIQYENTTWAVLKRIIWSIIISSLLVFAVVGCLFYLLKIIKHQKQLAEVKNDLISNITHEFKTPIATIGVALESIQNFNVIEDKNKTKAYLDMSNTQLSKLNTMVEKLLETATLDSENLELNRDNYNISEVLSTIVEKHKLQNSNTSITYNIIDNIFANVDIFHFENAINNIIDNAFKYGGNTIFVDLKHTSSQIEISISDNGNTLTKANKDRIFEKFYRIPRGNTHDVKGFGIGLYYSKKIIEKHGGSIDLELNNQLTTFKILLPNA
ncbi:HAMP domain-containing sensor histidine kinase [uncultured Psychroserpens sp.]|uniref:sensor histidine kinase n=1 Tax=uncultured Psychroserpens sp. TaxID=255436 RepID=UPI002635A467|nr:HAMP domain-containing sensor histidine kinase [uncultured Psychroserpens sp.]